MKPSCTCNKCAGECPTPYTCGIYFMQGQADHLDTDTPIPLTWRERVFITVTMTLAIAVWFIALALFIKNCLLK